MTLSGVATLRGNKVDKYLYLDAREAQAEMQRLLAGYPELAEDETLRLDMIEAETNSFKVIERVLSERQEAEMLIAGIKTREAALADRRHRLERKADAMRKLIVALMRAGHISTAILPEASLWLSKPRESVGVDNVDELPQGFFRLERKPDKKAIQAAFDAGEEVPGAHVVTGEVGLIVRNK